MAALVAQNYTTIAPVPSPLQVVSYCGSRPDVGPDSGQSTFVFDSGYTVRCAFKIKSAVCTDGSPCLLWNVYTTNGNTPSDTLDNGVSKQDVTTPARVTAGGPIANDANCGNPIVSPEGYILFQCQNAANTTQDVDPGTGSPGYSLYGCKAIPCTNANSAVLISQTNVRSFCTGSPGSCVGGDAAFDWAGSYNQQGGLDPHFYPWDSNKAYWSVQETSGSVNEWGDTPQFWSQVAFSINWSGAAPALSGMLGRWQPGNWVSFAGAKAAKCTRYYKASGISRNDTTGVLTMYTQADQVPGFTGIGGCIGTNCTDGCYAGNMTYRQSGLFSFTMDTTASGSNWTQIAPTAGQTPHIINGEYWPYYEFPFLLYGKDPTLSRSASTKMLVISNAYAGQLGLYSTMGFANPENGANKHDDYYVIDVVDGSLSAITNADTVGSAWHQAVSKGNLAAMAHGGYNPYGKFMVTRVVTAGDPDKVIRIPLNYVGTPVLKSMSVKGKVVISGKVVKP